MKKLDTRYLRTNLKVLSVYIDNHNFGYAKDIADEIISRLDQYYIERDKKATTDISDGL